MAFSPPNPNPAPMRLESPASYKLSSTQPINRNVLALQCCAPHLEVWSSLAPARTPTSIPYDHHFSHSRTSVPLLSAAAERHTSRRPRPPKLRHLSLSSSTILNINYALVPPLLRLQSLSMIRLKTSCVDALLRTDLTGLTCLAYFPTSVCSVFPALRVLSLNADTILGIHM
ncbi:hypothetical protein MVEN_01947400 [Mycena venus]|uniref:Uncharacterized protein n=1 Tax=Mycena venus TaxID=2733690 RepID=A0A8H7CJS1_9AGAR|nr:hypothetical protein MVEN_01947400 [Mycena venus]